MPLRVLRVRGFRNLLPQELGVPPGVNLVVGANGSGKTNLLEAVAVLGNLVSFRRAAPNAWVQHGSDAFLLGGEVERGGATVSLEQTGRAGTTLRRTLQRGARRLGAGEYLELFPVVALSSEDRELVWGVPEVRRRFLDRLSFHLHPRTLAVLQRYRRALKQRNALLVAGGSDAELEVFERDLADAGAQLVQLRGAGLSALEAHLDGELEALGWSLPRVHLRYHWRDGDAAGEATASAQGMRVALERRRRVERARGHTLVGPHRHDLQLFVRGAAARDVLSAGQGKLLATGLKLAALAAVEAHSGMRPSVVFDDVDAELDGDTLARVVARLAASSQVLLSSAHDEFLLPRVEAAVVWRMERGAASVVQSGGSTT